MSQAALDSGERKVAFKLLLLDDDEDTIAAVKRALGGEDFSVRAVRSGVEAFTAVMASRPDAIIADVGVRGDETRKLYQVVRHLEAVRTIPFFFLGSAGDSSGLPGGELSLPADGSLEKPLFIPDLREKIDRLRKAAGGDSVERTEYSSENATCNVREVLIDTIEFLVAAGRSGTLTVTGGGSRGRISFEEGVLRHASFGTLGGEEALLRMLRLEVVEVNFRDGCNEDSPVNLDIDWKIFAAAHC